MQRAIWTAATNWHTGMIKGDNSCNPEGAMALARSGYRGNSIYPFGLPELIFYTLGNGNVYVVNSLQSGWSDSTVVGGDAPINNRSMCAVGANPDGSVDVFWIGTGGSVYWNHGTLQNPGSASKTIQPSWPLKWRGVWNISQLEPALPSGGISCTAIVSGTIDVVCFKQDQSLYTARIRGGGVVSSLELAKSQQFTRPMACLSRGEGQLELFAVEAQGGKRINAGSLHPELGS